MENLDQPSIESNATITVLRVQLGKILMQERVSQKKDAVDVARRLMLSKQQLLAIEAGESASFHHERRYIQGIKSYVFYLGLQSRLEVESFLKQIEEWSAEGLAASPAAGVAQLHLSGATPANTKTYASRRPRFVYVGLAVLVLGGVVLAISNGWSSKDSDNERVTSESTSSTPMANEASANTPTVSTSAPAKTQSEAPAQSQTASPTQTPSQVQPLANPPIAEKNTPKEKITAATLPGAPGVMRIDFSAECWMSVQTTEGKKIDRIYKQGESFSIPLASVSALTLGNAPAAKVFFGERQVDVMSKGLAQGNVSRLDQQSLQRLQKN
jgi:cytoskeletal protein RodZ